MFSSSSSQMLLGIWCPPSVMPACSHMQFYRSASTGSLAPLDHSRMFFLCKSDLHLLHLRLDVWKPADNFGSLQGLQFSRLLWSAFLHADEMHLFYNMSSLLWKVHRAKHP